MKGSPEREKFKDALHYVIARASSRPGFGATKLYKVLWFANARTFCLTGEPIFETEFVREKHGPVPRDVMKMRGELVSEGRVKIWQDRFGDRPIWRFKSLAPPTTERFSSDEIKTIDYWIGHIDQDHTAVSISEQSHDYGWEIARMGETLPVHAFLAERLRDPTAEELERANRRMGFLGL